MSKKDIKPDRNTIDPQGIEKRRKKVEATATFGLILIALAMVAPFASFGETVVDWLGIGKWVYAAGALIFTFARIANINDPRESLRLRRLRRLEFWAGMAFCIGGFFWFYNENKFSHDPWVGPLAIVRDTVLFSLVGAFIQVIASWMIAYRIKKELKVGSDEGSKK